MWWRSLFDVLWFTLAYPVSLLLAVAVGYLVAQVNYRRRGRVWKPSGIENALVTIFGLLLSFTLLSSNNTLRERTTLIHQSSEAIAELYRESQLLPTTGPAVRGLLLQFLALELAEHHAKSVHDPAHALKLETLYRQGWQKLRDSTQAPTATPDELRRLLPAFNRLSGATSRLHYSYQEGTPPPIIALLLISSWAIGVLVGFTNCAQETRHYFVPLLFVVISALTVQAIRDLDNPAFGLIRPNYGNLQDLQRSLEQDHPPAPGPALP